MKTENYNGWTNYETWNVSLWMDNEETSYNYWRDRARDFVNNVAATSYSSREEQAKNLLAEQLKEEHTDSLPDLEGFAADLLNAAMSEVNWYEIAEHLVEEVNEDGEEESA